MLVKKTKHVLDGAFFYLAGPIDHAKDDGVGWRRKFISLIKKANINARIIDPTNKPPICNSETNDFKADNMKLREEGNYEELKKIVSQFRHEDLRFVDISDCLIAYVDPDVHMCGTYDEIFTAERQKKPRMLIVNGGLKRCPLWLFDVFRLDEMFNSVEECIDRLIKLNNGNIPLDKRWVLIRKHFSEEQNYGTGKTGIRTSKRIQNNRSKVSTKIS